MTKQNEIHYSMNVQMSLSRCWQRLHIYIVGDVFQFRRMKVSGKTEKFSFYICLYSFYPSCTFTYELCIKRICAVYISIFIPKYVQHYVLRMNEISDTKWNHTQHTFIHIKAIYLQSCFGLKIKKKCSEKNFSKSN